MKKILLTGAYKYSKSQINLIASLGFDVYFQQYETNEVENKAEYDAVICNGLFENHNIKDFTNLKYIQLTSAGFDRVPMEYIQEHCISIKNARGVYSIPIAEHTVMLILELLRGGRFYHENQSNHDWNKNRNAIELYKKAAVIAGFGNIGLEIAKRLKAFSVYITALDVHPITSEYLNEYRNIQELNESVRKTDVFISSMPYTKSTYHIFDEKFFSSMKKGALFINVSRGKLVNENALITALKNNRIGGAALDVFENEPLESDSKLWDIDNLIITPHNSFIGDGNSDRMFEVIYSNLKEWVS